MYGIYCLNVLYPHPLLISLKIELTTTAWRMIWATYKRLTSSLANAHCKCKCKSKMPIIKR